MGDEKKIKIDDEKTIVKIESMQRQIKSAGIDATLLEVVQMCIGLAEKTPEKWVVFLE